MRHGLQGVPTDRMNWVAALILGVCLGCLFWPVVTWWMDRRDWQETERRHWIERRQIANAARSYNRSTKP